MCGRFSSTLSAELVRRIFKADGFPNLPGSWNSAPSQDAMVIRRHPETGARRLDAQRWGLVPHFTKALIEARKPINARAETVATSGMFRGAFLTRRCIVSAALFYEWKPMRHGKQPFAIARRMRSHSLSAACGRAGGRRKGEILRTFAIITTAANREIAELHNRIRWCSKRPIGRPGLIAAN
jgi:putative SOS response-associated peptidase YedK